MGIWSERTFKALTEKKLKQTRNQQINTKIERVAATRLSPTSNSSIEHKKKTKKLRYFVPESVLP